MQCRITIDKEQLLSRSFNARGVMCWLRCGEGDVERERKVNQSMVNPLRESLAAENGQVSSKGEEEQPSQVSIQTVQSLGLAEAQISELRYRTRYFVLGCPLTC